MAICVHLAFRDTDHGHDNGLRVRIPQIVRCADQIGPQRIENDKRIDLIDVGGCVESFERGTFVVATTVELVRRIDKRERQGGP